MISIVVVTYNRLEYSRQCLQSVLDNTDVPFEVIVVDNGSTDGTPDWLTELKARHGEKIRLIFNDVNLGCAVAYNQGFKQAAGDPICRVDNDVILPEGWASSFMRIWDAHPDLGMLTTDLETEPREHPERVGVFRPHLTYFTQTVWHDAGLGSWCMAHRRSMFEQIGYYRTDFGLIVMNDTDLEKRAQNAGYRLGTVSGLRVGHLWQMASDEEQAYNYWKIEEQRRQVEVWNRLWAS